MSNHKHKRHADRRIEEITARIEMFLERTRQIEVELARKKRRLSG